MYFSTLNNVVATLNRYVGEAHEVRVDVIFNATCFRVVARIGVAAKVICPACTFGSGGVFVLAPRAEMPIEHAARDCSVHET